MGSTGANGDPGQTGRPSSGAASVWDVRIRQENGGQVPVLTVSGRLGSHGARQLEQALIIVEPPPGCGVVLDLAGVDYMSSTALAALQAMDLFLRESGACLVMCNVDDAVRIGLELAGLAELVDFAASREDALARACDSHVR